MDHSTNTSVPAATVALTTGRHLAPGRLSTSPAPRHGSLSPASIPSSPTSVHSAESAIFERDIEQPATATAHSHGHLHPHNPHRTPRVTSTEQSVPSVLDSAAAVLTADDMERDVDVELVSRAASRSPSPRTSLLLSGGVSPAISLMSPPIRPFASMDESHTPTTAYYSLHSSPTVPARELPPAPRSPQSSSTSPSLPVSSALPGASHSKRLSFVAYADLLASTPLSTVPLASLTTEPVEPPHLVESSPATIVAPDEWEREGLGMGLEERLAALGSRPSTRPPSIVTAF